MLGLSEPLSQMSSNFQDWILLVSQLHPSTQKNSGQTLQILWCEHVLCFGLLISGLGRKTLGLSEPLSQMRSLTNFQDCIVLVSQLHPSTQKNSGQTLQILCSEHVLCFGRMISGIGRKMLGLSEPLSQMSSNFQHCILLVSQLHPSTQKKSGQILQKV
jgi:hypothetical protein